MAFISLGSSQNADVIHPGIGETAPEIELKGPNDSIYKLSDLRGKMVLIDFWASWCRTCRVENRSYVKAYHKYKDLKFKDGDGFEIFSVSLDLEKDLWTQAIKNDKMDWEYHVSDFKKWDSPVVEKFNFKYLPHNLIIDKNGVVIAKEHYGNRLMEFLNSRLSE
ncbi:TlpA family protein disulfide reductase [bacterium]|nr:TlpA family protein disulfide reductase [bacterium]